MTNDAKWDEILDSLSIQKLEYVAVVLNALREAVAGLTAPYADHQPQTGYWWETGDYFVGVRPIRGRDVARYFIPTNTSHIGYPFMLSYIPPELISALKRFSE